MCSYDCSVRPTEMNDDNDITGIGVLIGYCATAGIAVLIILFHYFFTYDPQLDPFREINTGNPYLTRARSNPIDEIILRGPRKLMSLVFGQRIQGQGYASKLEASLIKVRYSKLHLVCYSMIINIQAKAQCILSMSDIQIITGISIIVSGATQLRCGISTYQWQVLVYLAWFSSLTHLSCLTLLRRYLFQRRGERIWRLVCMAILVILLILALLPTANYRWQYNVYPLGPGPPSAKDYAICYLKPMKRIKESPGSLGSSSFGEGYNDHATVAMSISVILLFIGFVSRVFKMHQSLSTLFGQTIRGKISHILRKILRSVECRCIPAGLFQNLKRLLLYRPLLALFLTARVIVDTWDSMFFEVWWLIISFVWGVERLFSVVLIFPSEENSQWSFGQVMSVALLAIPIVTVFEFFFPGSTDQEVEELRCRECSFPLKENESSPDLPRLSQLPSPIFQDLASRSFNDHPDYELYYGSGFLTVPTLTLLMTVISVCLWCLIRASMFAGLAQEGILQISFFPWGATPLVLIFCIYNSILFSFMVASIRSKSRDRGKGDGLIVRSLPTVITLLMTAVAFVMFMYAITYEINGWIALILAFSYFLCSLFIAASNRSDKTRLAIV
ncbi:uncharacterized protein N7469_002183 [Penicillium citrinum]|uniref:Uncharacterized protein n=1 Tax=Penicillium citrinum TaxID=5077 RepID=A0A9W9TTF8_PENCI|nr:uncharacterized protein N7469_002183 [Penicillium citrinum]KAJ5240592.1 hypothetical protein N7469_002183 [Penicillium citrinum]